MSATLSATTHCCIRDFWVILDFRSYTLVYMLRGFPFGLGKILPILAKLYPCLGECIDHSRDGS